MNKYLIHNIPRSFNVSIVLDIKPVYFVERYEPTKRFKDLRCYAINVGFPYDSDIDMYWLMMYRRTELWEDQCWTKYILTDGYKYCGVSNLCESKHDDPGDLIIHITINRIGFMHIPDKHSITESIGDYLSRLA